MKKIKTIKKRYWFLGGGLLISLVVLFVFLIPQRIPSVKASDMMKGIKAQTVSNKSIDKPFIDNVNDFAVKLLQATNTKNENILLSPLSAMVALSMTENGADGTTLSQMKAAINPGLSQEELNQYLHNYINNLPQNKKTKLTLANSIWYRDQGNLTINKNFLQMNGDYYNASLYKAPFNKKTVKDINNWVRANTDNKINHIIDKINDESIMYLISTLLFDAKWLNAYEKSDVSTLEFHNNDNTTAQVDGMHSNERRYLSDEKCTGFIKEYYNKDYYFVALLPNEGITIEEYLNQLTGEKFQQLLRSPQEVGVSAVLPKFKYDYSVTMNAALQKLGIQEAFSERNADFSKMGKIVGGNIYLDNAVSKAFISVDEQGTKAGFVFKIEMAGKSSAYSEKKVTLDRPFLYAVVDRSSNIPIIMGAVSHLN